MFNWKTLGAASLLMAISVATTNAVVINEYWADDASGDTNEFIELFGSPGESLKGLSLIVVDGDTGGNTASSNYRRVTLQIDFTAEVLNGAGFYLLGDGPDITPDQSIGGVNSLQNGSQTLALVTTSDIAFDAADTDELTAASVAAITGNLTDAVATVDSGAGDDTYFGTPVLGPNGAGFAWDTASRVPNGLDTDAASDWLTQDSFPDAIELGDANDALSTPGGVNVPEPASLALLGLGVVLMARRRRA